MQSGYLGVRKNVSCSLTVNSLKMFVWESLLKVSMFVLTFTPTMYRDEPALQILIGYINKTINRIHRSKKDDGISIYQNALRV